MSCSELVNINENILKNKTFKVISIHGKPTTRTTCSMKCSIHGDGDTWDNPWNPTIRSLKQDKGCPKCSHRYQYSEKEIISNLQVVLFDKTVSLESIIDYSNTTSRCVMKCSIHGISNEWDKPWTPRISDLKDGCGCPKCGTELKDINKLINQSNLDGLKTKTKFYFLNFERNGNLFTKIGITQQEINQRFKSCNLKSANLKITSEQVFELPTLVALILEFNLLNKHSELKEYQPSLKKYHIGGSTECFEHKLNSVIDIEKEINFIKNNTNTVIQNLIDNNIISQNKSHILSDELSLFI
jgi:hypothetical protein